MNRPPPYAHQTTDTRTLLERPAFGLFNDVGSGKTRIVVDAACELYRRGEIDTLFVLCPAPARSVWLDPSPVLGEFARWATVPHQLLEFRHNDLRCEPGKLAVVVCNPEFLRYGGGRVEHKKGYQLGGHAERLKTFLKTRKAFLVADEAWMYASPQASQAKTLLRLRPYCKRVALLNGTPGNAEHLYAPFCILDRRIFSAPFTMPDGRSSSGVINWFGFRDHYLRMGGFKNKVVVGYQNMDEFEARTKDWAVYRKTRDCVDLGETPIRTQIEVPLDPSTWKVYCQMRDELVAWFSENEAAVASQAATKTMRLAQITSGFVGGVETFDGTAPKTKEIGFEKTRGLLTWLKLSPPKKLVVFTKFRPDVERAVTVFSKHYPEHRVLPIYGGQSEDERTEAKTLLAPGGDPRPAVVVCNTQSGQSALNFAASDLFVFLANDWSLRMRQQAEGRARESVYPGRRVTYLDVLATGPKGERTIDHVMLESLRADTNIAEWTAAIWKEKLNGT